MSTDRSRTRPLIRAGVATLTLALLVASTIGPVAAAPARMSPAVEADAADTIPPFLPSPATLTFPARAVSTTSPVLTVTFSNTTPDPQTVAAIAIGGTHAADFAVKTETCTTAPIPAEAGCTMNVTFRPAAVGLRSAEVRLLDATQQLLGSASLAGVGQAVSHLGWGTTRTVGAGRTWSYGSGLARTVTSTGTAYLHAVYTTDRVGGANVTDHGPYLGVYYVRSASATGATWSTPVRINSSSRHGDDATIASAGSYVYVAWISQTRYINFSPSAPRALYIRVNSHHGSGTWRSPIRLTSATGRVIDAHVAAAGSHVYVSYTDSNTGRIRLFISADRGLTWRSVTIGSTTNAGVLGAQGGATVAASGSSVVVSWIANAAGAVKARLSTNGGSTWQTAVSLANGSSGLPAVAVLGGRIAVGWPTDSGVGLRLRTASGWGPVRSVRPPDTVATYAWDYALALALNGTSRVGVAWSACRAGCDGFDFSADLLWAESATNGGSWYATQVVGPASTTTTSHVNDGAGIVWTSAGSRTILWNGYTPNTTSYRMYARTSFGTP